MTEHPDFGVGGWLALLVLGMTILGPLTGFSQMTSAFDAEIQRFHELTYNTSWRLFTQISWVVFSITAALSILGGYGLWKIHTPESVRVAIIILWAIGPVRQLFYFLAAMSIFGEYAANSMISGIIQPVIIAAIWSLYLSRSVRVKNTYYYNRSNYSGSPTMEPPLTGE